MAEDTKQLNHPVPDGVRYARVAGRLLGILLIGIGLFSSLRGWQGVFEPFKALYFIAYGVLLNLPYRRIAETRWKALFTLLALGSAAFVFVMVVAVMFDYMAAAERGERLGVPGFEGTLIFLALLQVPAVLFQRKPELLD